jgi:hypothetical protein
MKSSKLLFIIFSFLSLLAIITDISCRKEPSHSTNYNFGEPFQIKVGEDITLSPILPNTLSDSSLSVKFQEVINDSRCSKSACYLCYGSSAIIQLLLTNNKINLVIPLTIPGCIDEYECNDYLYYKADTLGYRICLLRLDPYPETSSSTNPLNYTAKLNISKH